jgi:hypothetical protein
VTSANVRGARRNAYVLGATGLTVGALFLFPTSTNRASHVLRRAGVAAPGVVNPPAGRTPPGASGAGVTTPSVRTINGQAADTQYGPVQVQLRMRAGRIVAATAITYPQGSDLDRQINSYAIPVLQQETVAAQSAQIDSVSGATFTSDGYVRSLQSALDAAHA